MRRPTSMCLTVPLNVQENTAFLCMDVTSWERGGSHPLDGQEDDSGVHHADRAQHGHKAGWQPARALANEHRHARHPADGPPRRLPRV